MILSLSRTIAGLVGGILRAFVLDEIAEVGVVAVADGRLQRDRLLRHLQNGADALDRQLNFLGDFLRGGLAAVFLDQLLLHAHQLVDRFDHVHRDADGARLVGDRAGDRLANPPGGVGRELVAAAVFEFLDRLHQAHVAFLDQVEEGEAAVGVFLGDGNDEAQVGFDHFGLRLERLPVPALQPAMLLDEFFGGQPISKLHFLDLLAEVALGLGVARSWRSSRARESGCEAPGDFRRPGVTNSSATFCLK